MLSLFEGLYDLQAKSHLPRQFPDVFSGETEDDKIYFPTWLRDFEDLIESSVKLPSQRLRYLNIYTSGEANECISGYVGLKTADAYSDAKGALKEWYGDYDDITRLYKKRLKDWPDVRKTDDGKSLKKFSMFLQNCLCATKESTYVSSLDDDDLNQVMVSKLPKGIRDRWAKKVLDYKIAHKKFPPFKSFCEHVKYETKLATMPVVGTSIMDKIVSESKVKNRLASSRQRPILQETSNFSTSAQATSVERQNPSTNCRRCICCLEVNDHVTLDKCPLFASYSGNEKIEFVRQKGICFGCLVQGHISRNCANRHICSICIKRHPTAMHLNSNGEKDNEAICNKIEITRKHVLSTRIVPVTMYHKSSPDKAVQIYALLDEQSDTSFITDEVRNKLKLVGTDVKLKLSTLSSTSIIDSVKISDLIIKGLNEDNLVELPFAYSKDNITAKISQIPTKSVAAQHTQFKAIEDQLSELLPDTPIGLLIGTDCIDALKPLETIADPASKSYAIKTKIGWGIVGLRLASKDDESFDTSYTNKIVAVDVIINKVTRHEYAYKDTAKELLSPKDILNCLQQDFEITNVSKHSDIQQKYNISNDSKNLSFEDKRFIDVCEKGIHTAHNGHYEMPLPFRNKEVKLPYNRYIAMRRLKTVERKFEQDSTHKEYYIDFMSKNNYAEPVPKKENDTNATQKDPEVKVVVTNKVVVANTNDTFKPLVKRFSAFSNKTKIKLFCASLLRIKEYLLCKIKKHSPTYSKEFTVQESKTDVYRTEVESCSSSDKQVYYELLKENCNYMHFHFNVPNASHMGGVWERQIRSVRTVLNSILLSHGKQLNFDSLLTFMAETEAIVNSRPLTIDHLGTPDSIVPLSPQQLLTSTTKITYPPPSNYTKSDLYPRKQWKRVQHLADEFWHRWKTEYQQTLQARQKWNDVARDLEINDVVMLVDQNLPRNLWHVGIITKVYPSMDGKIRKVQLRLVDGLKFNQFARKKNERTAIT